ncbi:MAG: nicotinate phosphoribosyltransferase, partial [Atopobiaceae bacterium]|nr:nicotinate phosphoribosyltransferase [Atopobiaceae bacterium]
TIQSLFAQGAPIDSFGVGTKLATCDPQPSLGGVYKLSATRATGEKTWRPVMKLSEQLYKRTIPGIQGIRRYYDAAGCPVGDMIVVDDVALDDATYMVDVLDSLMTYDLAGRDFVDILVPLVENGERVGEPESIETAKMRCREATMHLDPSFRRFLNPQTYPVGLEPGLADLRQNLARRARA